MARKRFTSQELEASLGAIRRAVEKKNAERGGFMSRSEAVGAFVVATNELGTAAYKGVAAAPRFDAMLVDLAADVIIAHASQGTMEL